jgi:hypothetical protein
VRTEEDLRAALGSLERLAPDPDALLAAVTGSGPAARRTRRSWRRHPRVTWLAGTGALIAAGATAAALIIPGGPAQSRLYQLPGVTGGGPEVTTARQVLIAAARNIERTTPPPSGRFWVARGLVGNYVRVGPPGDPYVILEKTADQDWINRHPRAESSSYSRAAGVGFASAADRAAWRRDGAPSSWSYGQELTFADLDGLASGGTVRISTAPGKLSNDFGGNGGPDPTRQLPASPRRLKAMLLRGYSRAAFDGQSRASVVFSAIPRLFELPTTPQVRAALYQVLATLPGVTSLGAVRDASGRAGVAVALSSPVTRCGGEYKMGRDNPLFLFPRCVVQQRIVIDPQTGQPLAQELRYLELPVGQHWSAPGGLFSYELFSPGHWTSARQPGPH